MKKVSLVMALGLSVLVASASFAAPKTKAAPKAPKAKITAKQATKTALAKYPGKVVGKVPLENEEGKWQYAVTVNYQKKLHEVMVDCMTGKIASEEVTTAGDEAKEAAAEKKGAKKTEAKPEKDEKAEAPEKD
jgi:hypothetical protein